jgi:glycosyltransferase involved in cell wall biosynthesis
MTKRNEIVDTEFPENTEASSATADSLPDAAIVEEDTDKGLINDKASIDIEASQPDEEDEAVEVMASKKKRNATIKDTRPSILYCVPANILDISSGAALSQRTLMISLAKKGFRAVCLQATVFDSTHGGEHVLKAAEAHKDKKMLRANTNGVEHFILRTEATRRGKMTSEEQEWYLKAFREQIHHRRPDMVFMWGGMLLEMTMMREAREAGIPVIFYLVNGGYKNKETFKYVSTVVTDTESTASHYREKLGLDCKVLGKFIDPGLIKPKVPRRPDFITFINPSFEKGVSVFMPLAKLAAQECPEIKFLVVQSRGRWGNALNVLKFKPNDFPNVRIIGHQTDMRPVYASTRALLLPSLWHESGARVIAEAQINGIPILGSNTGGSAELIGQGGVMFDIPEEFREKKTIPATEDVIRPWLEEIKRVWHDQAYYEGLCRKVEQEAVQHDLDRNATRFVEAVSPVVLASKKLGLDGKPLAGKEGVGGKPNIITQALAQKKARQQKRNLKPRRKRK